METEALVAELWVLADRIWEACQTSEETQARFGRFMRLMLVEAPAPREWESKRRGHLRVVP